MVTPILSISQMREWENATWATGITPEDVIDKVGELIANKLLQLTKPTDRILFLAGKGHNGDDARAACERIQDQRPSRLIDVDPQHPLINLDCDLIVDGLFGIGLNRPLDEDWASIINQINSLNIPIISIDVPSGLGFGPTIRASRTLTVAAVKDNLLKGSDYTGQIDLVSNIGLTEKKFSSTHYWVDGIPKFPPNRKISSHKGTYGTCGIIAGSRGYHGAAVLATRGALRAKPGLVHLWTCAYEPVAAQLEMAMVHPWPEDLGILEKCTALLIGPGLVNQPLADFVTDKWQSAPCPVIVDASALDLVPPGEFPTNATRLITPHPGEAARLLNCSSKDIQANREAAAEQLAKKFGNCFVVLKGNQTITTNGYGNFYLNGSGNPGLAQGGSGDLLAGYLAGLLAQPELQEHPLETILHGVFKHGDAADKLELARSNWTINDLEQTIGL